MQVKNFQRWLILGSLLLTVMTALAVYALLQADYRLAFFAFLLGAASVISLWVMRRRSKIKTVDEDERTKGIQARAALVLFNIIYWVFPIGCLSAYLGFRFTGFNWLNSLAAYLGYSFIVILVLYTIIELAIQAEYGEFDSHEK